MYSPPSQKKECQLQTNFHFLLDLSLFYFLLFCLLRANIKVKMSFFRSLPLFVMTPIMAVVSVPYVWAWGLVLPKPVYEKFYYHFNESQEVIIRYYLEDDSDYGGDDSDSKV